MLHVIPILRIFIIWSCKKTLIKEINIVNQLKEKSDDRSLRCIFLIDQGRQVKSIFVMFVFNHYKIVVKQKKKPSRFSENAWTMVFLWNIYHIALLTFLQGKQKQNCLTCTIDCRHGSFVIDYLLSSRDPFTFFITQFLHDWTHR